MTSNILRVWRKESEMLGCSDLGMDIEVVQVRVSDSCLLIIED